MNADIWNLLHDGFITHVSGNVPGDVRLTVEIDYLRERFAAPGNRIVLTLHDCTSMTYLPFGDTPTADFPTLSAARPQILRARDWTDDGHVECTDGDLRVEAGSATLSLDGKFPLSLDQLKVAAEDYWAEFEARSDRPAGQARSGA